MKKILNKKGFSLSEMLIAVLIVAMVVAVVAGGGKVAKNAYQRVTLKAEAATLMSTTITRLVDEFRFASDILPATDPSNSTGHVTFQSGVEGYRVYLTNAQQNNVAATNGAICLVPVAYANTSDGAFWMPLLTDKTMTNGLVPNISEVTYENGLLEVTVSIYQDQLGADPYDEQTIKVRPLNSRA